MRETRAGRQPKAPRGGGAGRLPWTRASKAGNDGVTVINARNIADMPKTGAVWLSIFGVMTVLLAGASALLLRRKA